MRPTGRGLRFLNDLVGLFLPADGEKLIRVIDDFQQPNGIIGTPCGKKLYVTDIRAKKTYAYDIQQNGSLKNKRLFCELGSDGMTIDNEEIHFLFFEEIPIYI